MNFMKKASERKPKSLKLFLHSEIARYDDARDTDVLHASDMTKDIGFCPREFALYDLTGVKKKGSFLGTSQVTTFDSGDAIANLVITKWAVKRSIGTWVCLYCGAKHVFSKRPPICGPKCGSKRFDYKEESFWSVDTGCVGNKDMFIDLGEPLIRAVELKTMDKEEFKTLAAPLAEHRWRTNLYMRIIENSTHPHKHKINTKEATVLYVCRGYGFKDESIKEAGLHDTAFSPFKEFTVKRNDEETEDIWQKGIELNKFRKHGGPMPAGICSNGLTKRAQGCSVCKECFSGKYPAGKICAKP